MTFTEGHELSIPTRGIETNHGAFAKGGIIAGTPGIGKPIPANRQPPELSVEKT